MSISNDNSNILEESDIYSPDCIYVSVEINSITEENQCDGKNAREVVRYDKFVTWLFKPGTEQVNALHCGIGVVGEAGELVDAIKKEYIYNRPRDLKNIVEELGDIEFYLQATRSHYGLSRGYIIQKNAEKLEKRYAGLRYSDAAAIARADKDDSKIDPKN